MNEDNPMRDILRAEQLGDAKRMERDRMAWEAYKVMVGSSTFADTPLETVAEISFAATEIWLDERDKQRGSKA